MHTGVLNGPLDAGGAELDEVGRIRDLEAAVAAFELGRKAAEVEAGANSMRAVPMPSITRIRSVRPAMRFGRPRNSRDSQ